MNQTLSFEMKKRLTQILYFYLREADLHEATKSHIEHSTFLLSQRDLRWLSQYKDDIHLAICFHYGVCNDFPINTYNKLKKVIASL